MAAILTVHMFVLQNVDCEQKLPDEKSVIFSDLNISRQEGPIPTELQLPERKDNTGFLVHMYFHRSMCFNICFF